MKRKFENRKTISVHLDEAEYKWVELQAEGNISDWCRERILAEFNGEVMPTESDKTTGSAVETGAHRAVAVTSAKVEPLSRKRYCRHGLAFCRACQELDRMEAR